jgi:hypothetical protein
MLSIMRQEHVADANVAVKDIGFVVRHPVSCRAISIAKQT